MKTKLLWIINGILIVFCLYLFFALFEPYQKEIDTGWSEAAYRNPFLAAQHYLAAQGVVSHSLDTLRQETDLEAIDTLYIEDSNAVLSPQQVDVLMTWMREGGHVIITAHHHEEGSSAPLLDALQLSVTKCDCKKSTETAAETASEEVSENANNSAHEASDPLDSRSEKPEQDSDKKSDKPYRPITQWLRNLHEDENNADDLQASAPVIDPARLTRLHFDQVAETVIVHFSTRWSLDHPYLYTEDDEKFTAAKPFYWAGSEWGIHFMQFQIGDGLMTVLTDDSIWTSDNIGDHDHAYLLSILTDGSRQLYFLARNQMPSLFTLLWQHGKEIVIASTCWLILWLLHRGRRFLPPLDIDSTSRRSVAEHVQAVAYFLWHRRAVDKLLQTQRDEIQLRANMQVSGYSTLSAAQKIEALAKHCGLSAQAVGWAISSDEISNEDQFTEQVQLLQKIRTKL